MEGVSAGPLGQIFIGTVFGQQLLGGLLEDSWQNACVDVGYVALLLVVFEGDFRHKLHWPN